ncbi:MAG: hypothetical protein R3F19_18345 [Verrucomicrobiales bacterium]
MEHLSLVAEETQRPQEVAAAAVAVELLKSGAGEGTGGNKDYNSKAAAIAAAN